MKHHRTFLAVSLSLSLAACGGGGSTPSNNPAQTLAIDQALTNIGSNAPAPKPAYTGAFVTVAYVAIGFVSGNSEDAVARSVAENIAANPAQNAAYYKLMLSDDGLLITVLGGNTHVSALGNVVSDPDVKFVAKVGKDGKVVVVRT